MIGIQDSIKIHAKRKLSNRINIRASYKKSSYQKQNRKNIGSSEQFKVSGDVLNLSIDYSKGMDMISYPYYGVSLDYRF